MDDARLMLAERMGFHRQYYDQAGGFHEIGVDSAVALLAGLGIAATTEAEARDQMAALGDDLPWDVSFNAGTSPWVDIGDAEWQITLESGEMIEGRGGHTLPPMPLGIHRLVAGARRITLFSAPPHLPLPERGWGLMTPLYALSEKGVGSYDELTDLAQRMGEKGAAFLGVNPVHAGFPTSDLFVSPYAPSHRRRLNVLHVPTKTGRAGPKVDYTKDAPVRLRALRREFEKKRMTPAFMGFLAAEGAPLETFALHQALSDIHGPLWCDWPEELRWPQSAAAQAARAELRDEILFHSWLQWRAHEGLSEAQAEAKAAGMRHGLYLDLAVGTHPYGAETWEDAAHFARGVSLGAPPDAFARGGQNWRISPFNPLTLRNNSYSALSETFARQFQYGGVLRIDHILGFERAFWVPDDVPGSYLTMPRDPMLSVVRIEAARAGGVVVGEDLGNLPEGLRGALKGCGILGCRLALFETEPGEAPRFKPAASYDEAAIASFSTHDLPTWKGWRSGADLKARAKVSGRAPDPVDLDTRAQEVAAFDQVLPEGEVNEAGLHRFLAQTPSRLVALQSEVILGMEDQPNLPGTYLEYPNWRLRLSGTVEKLSENNVIETAAQIMRDENR